MIQSLLRGVCVVLLLSVSVSWAESQEFSFTSMHDQEEYILSNYPESIQAPGLGFEHILTKKQIRVMYHHRNLYPQHLNAICFVTNLGKMPAEIDFQQGLGGSSEDIVFAGHKAAHAFLQDFMTQGKSMTLEPGMTVPLLVHRIKTSQTSSGIFRISKRDPLSNLKIKLVFSDLDFPHLTAFSDVPGQKDRFNPMYFDENIRQIQKTFNVKDRIGMVSVGGLPYMRDRNENKILKGNYGLLYEIKLILNNPSSEFKRVQLFFAPSKNNAVDRGVMYVNGKLKEIGVLNYNNGRRITERIEEFLLKPNESRSVMMVTMPQAGCYYPIDLILKTVEH